MPQRGKLPSCAGVTIRSRCAGLQLPRATFRADCASYTCRWPRHKRVLPRLPFRPPAPPGRLHCVSDERVPGRQCVRVAWLREPQSAGSCCCRRFGFSCRRIRAGSAQACRAGTERKDNMELNGADIVVRCLAEEGVEHVFGYPGGAVLYIYDAIFKQDKFQHILVRHEQAAVHAADAYSRASQKVGVCLVTSGPGVTNAVTGIATAYMDSIPMVIISGQVPTAAIGEDAFQECDTVGIRVPASSTTSWCATSRTWPRPCAVPSSSPAPAVPAPCWSISRRTSPSRSAVRAAQGRDLDALVRAGEQGAPGPDQEGRADAAARRASHDLHGRRRDPVRCRRGLAPPGGPDRRAVHQHPDGPGRDAGHRPPLPGHARHARHLRGEHGDAALRRAAGHRGALR